MFDCERTRKSDLKKLVLPFLFVFCVSQAAVRHRIVVCNQLEIAIQSLYSRFILALIEKLYFFYLFPFLLPQTKGLTIAEEETVRSSNFLHRKPNRNYRTKASTASPKEDDEIELSPNCPEADGYFADAEQCDKYYACSWAQSKCSLSFLRRLLMDFFFRIFSDGKMNERLCPDGMVFNDYDKDVEKCDLPYNIDCSKRSKLRKLLSNNYYSELHNQWMPTKN